MLLNRKNKAYKRQLQELAIRLLVLSESSDNEDDLNRTVDEIIGENVNRILHDSLCEAKEDLESTKNNLKFTSGRCDHLAKENNRLRDQNRVLLKLLDKHTDGEFLHEFLDDARYSL